MTPDNEKELWEFVGEVRTDIKGIKQILNKLPCAEQEKKIEDLEDYKNQMIGRVSIISIVCGIIGYGISMAISWMLKLRQFFTELNELNSGQQRE